MFSNKNSDMLLRYPPTLLERLQDEEPKSVHDRLKPVDMRTMRNIVQKDLTDLINHSNIEATLNESKHSPVIKSVLNYGISALMGSQENSHSWSVIEKKIRKAILYFEPRVIPESLIVRSLQKGDEMVRHAVIAVEIRGLIHWKPKPIDLCMSGRYDFESEKVQLNVL